VQRGKSCLGRRISRLKLLADEPPGGRMARKAGLGPFGGRPLPGRATDMLPFATGSFPADLDDWIPPHGKLPLSRGQIGCQGRACQEHGPQRSAYYFIAPQATASGPSCCGCNTLGRSPDNRTTTAKARRCPASRAAALGVAPQQIGRADESTDDGLAAALRAGEWRATAAEETWREGLLWSGRSTRAPAGCAPR